MSLKTKLKLYEYVNQVWQSMRKEYGDDGAKQLLLHWLFELKEFVITKKGV